MSEEDKSLLVTQVLSIVLGTAVIAFYLYGAYKKGKKEFQKTLKSYKG